MLPSFDPLIEPLVDPLIEPVVDPTMDSWATEPCIEPRAIDPLALGTIEPLSGISIVISGIATDGECDRVPEPWLPEPFDRPGAYIQ